jgi:hypothetical protein
MSILSSAITLTPPLSRYILLFLARAAERGESAGPYSPFARNSVFPFHRNSWESPADSSVIRIRQRKPMVGRLFVHRPMHPASPLPICRLRPMRQP